MEGNRVPLHWLESHPFQSTGAGTVSPCHLPAAGTQSRNCGFIFPWGLGNATLDQMSHPYLVAVVGRSAISILMAVAAQGLTLGTGGLTEHLAVVDDALGVVHGLRAIHG